MGSLLDNVRKSLFGDPVLQPTNVTSELAGAGAAFAVLIEGVGKAVATTQAELDATSGRIATEMAKTQVDTVQAVVTEYGDDGNILDVNVVVGKTSALSIAVPPALSFKRVHLEGRFVATEFSATQHSNVNVNLVSANVSSKGFFRGVSASGSVVNANTDVQTEQTVDTSVGTMSMTALIRPKPVTALAKPPLVLKGPKLTLTVFKNLPIATINPPPATPDGPPALYRRGAVVQVQLLKTDLSGGLANKTIAVDCAGLDSDVTDNAGATVTTGPKTDASGVFFVTVSRTVTSPTDAKKDFIIRGSLNLINATVNVSL
jgi:hypothetical protein